jgi:hypothetical protein
LSESRRTDSGGRRPVAYSCVAFALVFVLAGCAPIIAHGPDVHPGFSGGVSAALGNGPTYENGDDPVPFYLGAAEINAAYGIRPESDSRPAFRFGLQAPTAGAVSADIFTQAPRRWLGPVAAGGGILGEFSRDGRLMPYLQAGVRNDAGFGINVAVGRYWNHDRRASTTVNERAQVNWLNFEVPLGERAALHLHAGYASGHVKKTFNGGTEPYVDEDRWVRLGGATLEFHR